MWWKIVQVLSTAGTIAGMAWTFYQEHNKHRRKALKFSLVTFAALMLCITAFIHRDSESGLGSGTTVLPTTKPTTPLHDQNGKHDIILYPTTFLHRQFTEEPKWVVDGREVDPANSQLPNTTILRLTKGQHQVTVRVTEIVCTVSVNVPVPSEQQDVTLNCRNSEGK